MPQNDASLRELLRCVDEAARVGSLFEIKQNLARHLPIMDDLKHPLEGEDQTFHEVAIAWAFSYNINVTKVDNRWRVLVESVSRGADGTITPPPVSDLPREAIEIWIESSNILRSPYALARINHLLFEKRKGNVVKFACLAAENYLRTCQMWHVGLDRSHYLNIAFRLARAVNAKEVQDRVFMQIRDDMHTLITQKDSPGAFFRMMRPLADEKSGKEALRDILDLAWKAYLDTSIRDDIAALQIHLCSGAEERKGLWEKRIQIWHHAAEDSAGIRKLSHLKKALHLAHASKQSDLIERAAATLQKMRDEDLGLVEFSSMRQIDQEEIQRFLSPVVEATSWQHALMVFWHSYGPVTGDAAKNQETADQHAREFVFSNMLNPEILGADGLPRFTPNNETDKREVQLARVESFSLQIFAPLLGRALMEVSNVHGIPPEDDIVDFFSQSPLVDDALARSLTRSLVRFWTGDVEAATYTLLPMIERLARDLVLKLDAGVYRLQRAEKPGQYPGLRYLLDVLREKGMDESWYRATLTTCANPAGGWNIRNEIAHGFVLYAGLPVFAVLFQLAMHLWFVGLTTSDDSVAAREK